MRLREARLRAGLTQQQLAAPRYTKAYVSALEHGIAKPSMAALNFFADRLGMPASRLMSDEAVVWSRVEADLNLAAGRWQVAVDGYRALLEAAADASVRAELLRGMAEGLARLDRGAEAAAAASEAAETFTRLDRPADAALASYWLAYGEYEQENADEARAVLEHLLADVRAGLQVEPDFKLRVLISLGSVESREGRYTEALGYLEEVRGLAASLDDRRRGAFLYDLALTYRETGDLEGAIRTGYAGLALLRASEADAEMASLENSLALAFLQLGNAQRAAELVASSRTTFERLGDERQLAHVLDTQASVAIAQASPAEGLDLARRALDLAIRTDNEKAQTDALVTSAHAYRALGQTDDAVACFERAAAIARASGRRGRLREVLGAWADLCAELGDHRRAFELSREALAAG